MKKAFLASKWWFYIPLISMLFAMRMSKWVFEGETELDRVYRNFLIMGTACFHAIPSLFLIQII